MYSFWELYSVSDLMKQIFAAFLLCQNVAVYE